MRTFLSHCREQGKMKKLTFSLLALSSLVAALPALGSFTCDDPSFPNLTKYFEEAKIDIPIPFCSSPLAGGAQEAPASAPNFKIQLVTEPTTTASPDDNGLKTPTILPINTTLPIPPQPTHPLPFPRRHLHALNHRDTPSPTDPPSAALSKICSCLLAQASPAPPPPPVYITILPRPLPTTEPTPGPPGGQVFITVFPAPFPPIALSPATTSTSTVDFQIPVVNAVFPSDGGSPATTTTTAGVTTPTTAATPTRAPPLRFITRTTTTSLLGTLTSTETTTTTATVQPLSQSQPQPQLELQMKIAHSGPGPGPRSWFARVALAAHGGDDDVEKEEELTTTMTTTVEVTATAGTVTVTSVSVSQVTAGAAFESGSGFVCVAGVRVGRIAVAVEASGVGGGDSGPGSGEGAVGGEEVGSGMGLYCPGEEAKGYCCSGVNNTTSLPGGGGDGDYGNDVECKSPSQHTHQFPFLPRPFTKVEKRLIQRHLLPGTELPGQSRQAPDSGLGPRTPNCPAKRPVPLCCIVLASEMQAPVLGAVRLLRCSPPGPPQSLPSTMAPPPESSTTTVTT